MAGHIVLTNSLPIVISGLRQQSWRAIIDTTVSKLLIKYRPRSISFVSIRIRAGYVFLTTFFATVLSYKTRNTCTQ